MSRSVKSRGFLAIGAALLAVGAALAWSAVRAEREFRRMLQAGEQSAALGNTLEAIEAFSGALALQPQSMVAHLKRGDAYRLRREYEPALRDLRDAAALDATAPRPLELLADVNAAMGRHDRAIELYRQFLALDDRAPRVLYKLGLTYYATRRSEQAIEPLRRALNLDERLSEAHYLLGLCLRDARRQTDAIASLRRAIALSPGLVPAREALADTYGVAGRRREQLEQLEAIAALEPERPQRLVSIAAAYAEAGRANAAIAALDRLGDNLPDDALLRTEVARTWLTTAEMRADRQLARRARSLLEPMATPGSASGEVLALLGRAQLLLGEVSAAERNLQLAVARLPVPSSAFLNLAEAAERRQNLPTARSALIDFASLTSDDAARQRAAIRVAELSLRLNDPAAAAEWAERSLDTTRPTPASYLALATAELRLNRRARARDVVARGLLANPGHAGLVRLRRQLGS